MVNVVQFAGYGLVYNLLYFFLIIWQFYSYMVLYMYSNWEQRPQFVWARWLLVHFWGCYINCLVLIYSLKNPNRSWLCVHGILRFLSKLMLLHVDQFCWVLFPVIFYSLNTNTNTQWFLMGFQTRLWQQVHPRRLHLAEATITSDSGKFSKCFGLIHKAHFA